MGVVLPPLEVQPSSAEAPPGADAETTAAPTNQEQGPEENDQDAQESPQNQETDTEPQESRELGADSQQESPHDAPVEMPLVATCSEYHVTWIESSDTRLRVVKMFEIVPVASSDDD